MGIQSDSALEQGQKLIEEGKIDEAENLFDQALQADLECEDLVFALQSCKFWNDTFKQTKEMVGFEKGELLVSQWKRFKSRTEVSENPSQKIIYAFQKGIYSIALEAYANDFDEGNIENEAERYRKAGLCCKKLGSYEKALLCLKKAYSVKETNAAVVAEMADCYALCGEDKRSKLLFKEAFFIDPQKVDLEYLDSPLINILVEKVRQKGFKDPYLKEWIPVYGVLLGAFSVKRELRSSDLNKIRQEIYSRKNELKDPRNDAELITPRLLNLFFWLIDHYVISKESISKINEVLLEIKILDPAVYNLYVR